MDITTTAATGIVSLVILYLKYLLDKKRARLRSDYGGKEESGELIKWILSNEVLLNKVLILLAPVLLVISGGVVLAFWLSYKAQLANTHTLPPIAPFSENTQISKPAETLAVPVVPTGNVAEKARKSEQPEQIVSSPPVVPPSVMVEAPKEISPKSAPRSVSIHEESIVEPQKSHPSETVVLQQPPAMPAAEESDDSQRRMRSIAPAPSVLKPAALSLVLKTTHGSGATVVYRVNEILQVAAEVSRNAYLYCYYQDGKGAVMRIFPNPFQPDAFVATGHPIQIPHPRAPFQLNLDTLGVTEQVSCIASDRELGATLPQALRGEDMKPLPVDSIDEVIGLYQAINGDQEVATTTVAVKVIP